MSNWQKGTKLNNGQYIIESILLRSGYGLFYRAKETQTDQLVTINATKIFWRSKPNAKELEQKLIKQAEYIGQKCYSPYIVKLKPQVFQEQNQVYMVTDYLDGIDLGSYIDRNGVLPSDEALNIVIKIASAVNILHKNKIVHQDIKPQNIIIDSATQNPVLINYGIGIKLFALANRKHVHNLNDCFIPPEKLSNNPQLSISSDIYSLAATLYTLATGKIPLSANLRTYHNTPLPTPKEINPRLSQVFSDAIIKGMELELKQRPHHLKNWLDLFPEQENTVYPFLNNISSNLDEVPSSNKSTLDAIVTNYETSKKTDKSDVYDETIVQSAKKKIAPATITTRSTNYPDIEKFTFETVKLQQEKNFFGWISKDKKKLLTVEGQFFVEYLGDGVNLDMVFIPEGTFMMGGNKNEQERDKSENPQHRVNLKSFYMSKYPITQIQWRVVSRFPKVSRNLKPKPSFFKGRNGPVEKVSWLDAQEFCKRLSKFTTRNYRLPTESEWEYACRGNTDTTFFFGDIITPELANYDAKNNDKDKGKNSPRDIKRTTPVDNFYPNPFGLYDCHGNVWEWCEDHYTDNYTRHPRDGSAYYSPTNNPERVVRGGSWSLPSNYCRSAKRNSYIFDSSYNFIGMRVVCVID